MCFCSLHSLPLAVTTALSKTIEFLKEFFDFCRRNSPVAARNSAVAARNSPVVGHKVVSESAARSPLPHAPGARMT